MKTNIESNPEGSGKTGSIDWQAIKDRLKSLEHARTADASQEHLEPVFRERAQLLAARQIAGDIYKRQTQVLLFSLSWETFGVELRHLREILPFRQCTPVPKTSPLIQGVINLRGDIFCVIDLGPLMEMAPDPGKEEPKDEEPGGYVLILKDFPVGLRVDRLHKIQPVDEARVRDAKKSGDQVPSQYIACVTWEDTTEGTSENNIALLDIDKILSHPVFSNDTGERIL